MDAAQFFANIGKLPSQYTDDDLDAVQVALDNGIDTRTLAGVWVNAGADGVRAITINPALAPSFLPSLGPPPADFVGVPVTEQDRENALSQGFVPAPPGMTINGEALPEGAFVQSAAGQAKANELAEKQALIDAEAAGENVSQNVKDALRELGLGFRGLDANGNIIAVDPATGKEFIYGQNEDGSIFRLGAGSGSGGGGGAAAVRLQNIGVDKDGFALVFNPATGSITKGPQVGFGQIDPRTIAAEEARQFNEQQSLKEGEFLRDVLSNGRNFLTAAFLSRGQRGGSPLAETTQADLLGRGFGPQQSLGGLNQALGFLSPSDQAKVPGFVLEGLAEQGALGGGGIQFPQLQPGATPTTIGGNGGVRPGEVDPNTLARPAGATFGQTSSFAIGDKPQTKSLASTQSSGFGPGISSLGEMALAFAPPAVKDIAAGKEVGSLSTSGAGGFSIPLANPQTLSNLTADERGALDTTLQNTDQRTLSEFEQESAQRFRGQGSRLGTRA
jgi:hypothetical protein